ncbi:MAG: hypothetical protein J1F31_05900 [Erysipelotrichales bacterium]|nr:hypothetical protein [Erysipelotrichales bacterium]
MDDINRLKNKIPIVIGVTGHRNIAKDDFKDIKEVVEKGLSEIVDLCKKSKKDKDKETPVILLTGLAEGADMLVTDVAIDLEIPYIAVLPCKLEEYKKSFSDKEVLDKLDEYIKKALDTIIVDDIENDFDNQPGQTMENYRYRQVGIYIVQHSSLLLALWDGEKYKEKYGCGTADIVDIALNHTFVKKEIGPYFGMVGNCSVMWIKCRREGDDKENDIVRKYLLPSIYNPAAEDKYHEVPILPEITKSIIKKTIEYNSTVTNLDKINKDRWLLEENEYTKTSDYQKSLHSHYLKSDNLSGKQKTKFTMAVWFFAILGMAVALLFTFYDEGIWMFCSLLCGLFVVVLIIYYFYANSYRRQYHRKYLEWRALAETLRTQFYVSVCGLDYNICDSFTWMQKNDMVWIDRAIAALSVGNIENRVNDLSKIRSKWIGDKTKSEGQYGYHARKKLRNGKIAKKHRRWSNGLLISTLILYAIIFIAEILGLLGIIDCFDAVIINNYKLTITTRQLFQMTCWVLASVSLLLTASLGKLSYSRHQRDNERMECLYFTSLNKWDTTSVHFKQLVITLAREEIVENGIWLSYMADNDLEITL